MFFERFVLSFVEVVFFCFHFIWRALLLYFLRSFCFAFCGFFLSGRKDPPA